MLNIIKLFLLLFSLQKRGSPCDFAPKTWDTAQGYLKCVPRHIGDPVVRTDGHVNITSLPKILIHGAPRARLRRAELRYKLKTKNCILLNCLQLFCLINKT